MKNNSGFTLIELMITVAVLAIIVAIGYPSYVDQMQKTRRADAKSALMDAAAKMERYYTQFGGYSATLIDSGIIATSPGQFYQIAPVAVTNQTFLLRATGVGNQGTDVCGNLQIDQSQQKTLNGNSVSGAVCGWE